MLVDIALISGSRPALLARTMRSFQDRVFQNFSIGRCYANIDLFGGSVDEREECRLIILEYFPSAVIEMPDTPGFGKAVKTVWSMTEAPYVFHLEDDWVALDDIVPDQVLPLLSGSTKAVRPVTANMNWNGRSQYHESVRKDKFWGITYKTVRSSAFGTSPGFFVGDFVRRCAELMNPELDPEKQMRPPHNPALAAFMAQYRCRVLPSRQGGELFEDIGREWRSERGIQKVVSQGRSSWINASS